MKRRDCTKYIIIIFISSSADLDKLYNQSGVIQNGEVQVNITITVSSIMTVQVSLSLMSCTQQNGQCSYSLFSQNIMSDAWKSFLVMLMPRILKRPTSIVFLRQHLKELLYKMMIHCYFITVHPSFIRHVGFQKSFEKLLVCCFQLQNYYIQTKTSVYLKVSLKTPCRCILLSAPIQDMQYEMDFIQRKQLSF